MTLTKTRILLALLFVGAALFGCSKKEKQAAGPHELQPATDGSARFEVSCVARVRCDRKARQMCPTGFEVESETTVGGADYPAFVDRAPAGNALEKPKSDLGSQVEFVVIVRCSEGGL